MKKVLVLMLMALGFIGCKEEEGMDIASLIVGVYVGGGEDNSVPYSNGKITISKVSNKRVKITPSEGTPMTEQEIGLLYTSNIVSGDISTAPVYFSVDLNSATRLLYLEEFNEGLIFQGVPE